MAGKKILITDDNKKILELMERFLSREGFTVITCTMGTEAVTRIRDERPDLILMDIMLPDMQGSDVIKKIKQDPILAAIPVVFLSGIAADSSTGFSEIQVDGYHYKAVAKPFDPTRLLEEIKRMLA